MLRGVPKGVPIRVSPIFEISNDQKRKRLNTLDVLMFGFDHDFVNVFGRLNLSN